MKKLLEKIRRNVNWMSVILTLGAFLAPWKPVALVSILLMMAGGVRVYLFISEEKTDGKKGSELGKQVFLFVIALLLTFLAWAFLKYNHAGITG